jgi:hypothetical protein
MTYVLVDEQDGDVRSLGELLEGSFDGGRLSLYNSIHPVKA